VTLDANGNKLGEMKYTPFGETRYATGSVPTDRRFTGQRQEDSGFGSLYDYGARFYSPLVGRFLSADAIVPNPNDPQQLNRYVYVGNNPIRNTDPTGRYSPEEILASLTKNLSLNFTLAPTDDRASEIQQGKIIAGFLLPAHEQATEAIDPGMSHFDYPPTRLAPTGSALTFFFALALSGTCTM